MNCCRWGSEIARGMAYLTDMKLVHRDLATRNILIAGERKICKISDFGLTRDIYVDDAYWKRGAGKCKININDQFQKVSNIFPVPIKWMAPESLTDHVYTTKSDVWSFGIVLWEMCSLGCSPYPGISVVTLYRLLQVGYRMNKPPRCPNQL